MRQSCLNIPIPLIPPLQGSNGEAMSQVVKPRGAATFIDDTRGQTQLLPVRDQARRTVAFLRRHAVAAPNQSALRLVGNVAATQLEIMTQFLGNRIRQRNQTRLIELGGFDT